MAQGADVGLLSGYPCILPQLLNVYARLRPHQRRAAFLLEDRAGRAPVPLGVVQQRAHRGDTAIHRADGKVLGQQLLPPRGQGVLRDHAVRQKREELPQHGLAETGLCPVRPSSRRIDR